MYLNYLSKFSASNVCKRAFKLQVRHATIGVCEHQCMYRNKEGGEVRMHIFAHFLLASRRRLERKLFGEVYASNNISRLK